MSIQEVQDLQTGVKIKYAGKILTIKDWKCHKDCVMFGNTRIWAEPIFDNGLLIHPSFWKEIQIN